MSRPAVRFQRANFLVSDLDKSYQLYLNVLGMTLNFEKESEPDSYSYPVFGIDKKSAMRFAVLDTETQTRVMALTEIDADLLANPELPRRSAIVLDIADMDAVLAGAAELGLTIYPEERLETHDGRVGREVGLLDFDGNLIVTYSIPAS